MNDSAFSSMLALRHLDLRATFESMDRLVLSSQSKPRGGEDYAHSNSNTHLHSFDYMI